MSLSRKIILASSVCAAFLAIGIGCSVEDRDIEKKDLFMCQKDDDCLTGSRCVKASESQAFGSCEREDDISHCVDNDKDGFYRETSSEYFNECGFSETNQRDPDDSNPAIKPGANEVCDGADNSADGCIDGNCKAGAICGERNSDGTLKDGGSKCPPGMECDGNNDDNCEPIIKPCWGGGNYKTYYLSVCSAAAIGVQYCIVKKEGNTYVGDDGGFAKGELKGSPSSAEEVEYTFTVMEGSCPETEDEIPGFDKYDGGCPKQGEEDYDPNCVPHPDDKDSNCDGQVDSGAGSVCDDSAFKNDANARCIVTDDDPSGIDTFIDKQNYKSVLTKCNNDEASCPCIGLRRCKSEGALGEPVCMKGSNQIVASSVQNEECYKR